MVGTQSEKSPGIRVAPSSLYSDIFFDEVRLDLLDMDTIGLNNDDFQVSSRKEYEKDISLVVADKRYNDKAIIIFI